VAIFLCLLFLPFADMLDVLNSLDNMHSAVEIVFLRRTNRLIMRVRRRKQIRFDSQTILLYTRKEKQFRQHDPSIHYLRTKFIDDALVQ
jgi:hypothetical protein